MARRKSIKVEIAKHEEDDNTDWQTVYKLYKYRNKYKVKIDEDF